MSLHREKKRKKYEEIVITKMEREKYVRTFMRMNGRYDYDEIKVYVPLLFPFGCILFRKTKNIYFFVLICPFYAAEVSL